MAAWEADRTTVAAVAARSPLAAAAARSREAAVGAPPTAAASPCGPPGVPNGAPQDGLARPAAGCAQYTGRVRSPARAAVHDATGGTTSIMWGTSISR